MLSRLLVSSTWIYSSTALVLPMVMCTAVSLTAAFVFSFYYGQIAAGLHFRKSQRAFPFSAIYWTGWTGFYCTMYAPQLANLFNSLNWFNHTPREVVACSVSVISYIVSLGSHLTTHKTQSGPGICCGYESVTWSRELFHRLGILICLFISHLKSSA